ncbi:uncharacterized protein LOC112589967 [Harpegnathos saltator]|uniref:uncharacterized protein LOC112589967 n=1 Tax=Harpegnathos saltator TaxID=610380 RepID=UPI000DBEDA99|nr:uncharacterized protein LOC112589967 [Harpegnathos saltator]
MEYIYKIERNKCHVCNQKFYKNQELIDHLMKVHGHRTIFNCSGCDYGCNKRRKPVMPIQDRPRSMSSVTDIPEEVASLKITCMRLTNAKATTKVSIGRKIRNIITGRITDIAYVTATIAIIYLTGHSTCNITSHERTCTITTTCVTRLAATRNSNSNKI